MLRLALALISLIAISGFIWFNLPDSEVKQTADPKPSTASISNLKITPSPIPISIPDQKILSSDYHIFQSFNNCGPAALSMALNYYGINRTQQQLGQELRPYQNPQGDNDDKSVTLAEVAIKAKEYGLIPYHRPAGNVEIIQQLIALDLPVISRTWLKIDDDIGHYRVIKGYNKNTKQLVQDDSLQGKNLTYSYQEFNQIWSKYNYEFLVLVPADKEDQVKSILAELVDSNFAWQQAANNSEKILATDPNDLTAAFNLSIAKFHLKDYAGSIEQFEKIENRLTFRTLWYQIEPILSYYELKDYDRVLQITDKILNNQNRAFSELYLLRGKVYQQQGNITSAKAEFQKAVLYNSQLIEAQEELSKIN